MFLATPCLSSIGTYAVGTVPSYGTYRKLRGKVGNKSTNKRTLCGFTMYLGQRELGDYDYWLHGLIISPC